ncbi:MAG: TlpA family protein disulfide reductase [Clostridiales bacterium]|nr:TlpA family protein disulfide reductase [Clostridiales bacterium]
MKQRTLKYLLLSFAICLMLISIGALSACSAHVHNFGDYKIIFDADCETPGEKSHTCLSCGYTETEVIQSGHNWSEFEITKNADCETKGEKKRICSVCEYEDIEVLPAIGHNWSEFSVKSSAKCDAEGKQTRTCSNCGTEDFKVIPATGHSWSYFEISVPAKCETAGKKTRTCTVCKEEETADIPALEHIWSDYNVTSATCDKEGTKTRSCELCRKEESEEIAKLDHKWSEFSETVSAKCGVKGEKIRSCDVCHIEEKADIPALEHVWENEVITKKPTCVDDGLKTVQCKLCKIVNSEEVIPALGHTKGRSIPLIGETCEKEGKTQVTCSVCQQVYYEYPPATGHNYSDEFTIDKTPTIYEEGEQSRHCTNYGCKSRTDIHTIAKLISEAYFRIYIVRGENQQILPKTYNPMIKIVDEQGKTVTTSFVFGDANREHIFEKLLPFGTYTVSIVNTLPSGFECGEYTISERNGIYPYDTPEKYPTITMHLYSHLGEGQMTNGDKRGTVLNDFSVTTVYGQTVRLSDLLREKKLVWLNFYYNACYPCQSEAPEIIRMVNLFDVAVICFNSKDSLEEIKNGAKSIFKFPDNFYIVQDSGDTYGKLFGRYAFPLNVFIDSGGCVFESVTGSNYSSQFYKFISDNLFETPEKVSTVSVAIIELPALLPDKKRYL